MRLTPTPIVAIVLMSCSSDISVKDQANVAPNVAISSPDEI
mgnify:FL=1